MYTKDKMNEIVNNVTAGALVVSVSILAIAILISLCVTKTEAHEEPQNTSTPEPTECVQILHTEAPTDIPIAKPTNYPTKTEKPTEAPTSAPTEAPTTEPTEEPTATPEPTPEWFIVYATSYTDTYNTEQGRTPTGCKDDIPLEDHWSIASFLDERLPYGTIIEIENMGVYEVCDTCEEDGAVWKQRQYDITEGKFQRAETWIDIYFENAEEAEAFGRSLLKVRILKYGDGTYTTKESFKEANK